MRYLFSFLLLISSLSYAQEHCDHLPPIAGQNIQTLYSDAMEATAKQYVRLVGMEINHAGKGDISLLLNEKKEVVALRINYADGKEVTTLNITAEELNSGKLLMYPGEGKNASPLRLSVTRPPGLNPATGGTFNIDIASDIDPVKLKNYKIVLSKQDGAWVAKQASSRVNKVIIHPGISFLNWDGTFQKVEFK